MAFQGEVKRYGTIKNNFKLLAGVTITVCFIFLLAVCAHIFYKYAQSHKDIEITSYTVKGIETSVDVGNMGYFVDLDVAFISKDKRITKSLGNMDSVLKDVIIRSIAETEHSIKSAQGKREAQQNILRLIKNMEPEVYQVSFPNFLMVPLYSNK